MPELWLFFHQQNDLKQFVPIFYYECIISFTLVCPALWLPGIWGRIWISLIGLAFLGTTLVAGFQAVSIGARWDLTAHSALMQTYTRQVLDFSHTFGSVRTLCWLLLLAAAFVVCLVLNLRSTALTRRQALILTLGGLLFCAYGVRNFLTYGRSFTRNAIMANGTTLAIAGIGPNSHHPLLRLALTHYNYRLTHDYYIAAYRQAALHRGELQGAEFVPGAVPPRILLVVIGESAGRRHWSLYGYHRETTPRLAARRDELLVYQDTISTCVGTQAALRAMLDTTVASQPVFPLFSAAGYTTHWFSSKQDQSNFDVEVSALVQSCDERLFLNGAYDENLLPLVRRVIATPGRHVIFLNLYGSHVRYQDRYPSSRAVFHGRGNRDHILATYDNSIRYTDFVLDQLITLLSQEAAPSCMVYVSDHAEDVYDSTPDRYLFRSDSLATDPMYEVPFIAWFSPAYRQGNPDLVRAATAAQNKKIQTPGFYHHLIDLARLTHPIFNPAHSVFSSAYVEPDRHVGNAGRLYEKAPP